ncbi:MAG TPA: hypothetical protein PK413_05325 [Thermoanaerobaculia bacterium]|nr:hypothetical protein [Thermoanaerobaculia bacterium]
MSDRPRSTISIELEQPAEKRLRDLWHLLATINNLYNIYTILTLPEMQAEVEKRSERTHRKDPNALLYSSALEDMIGRSRRLHVTAMQQNSPLVITLEGATAAMGLLSTLLGLLVPVYELVKTLREKKVSREERQLELERKRVDLLSAQLGLIDKVQGMKLPEAQKNYILDSVQRLMRSLELNPVKALLR